MNMNYKEMWDKLKLQINEAKYEDTYRVYTYTYNEVIDKMKKLKNEQYTKSLTEAGY